MTSPCQNVVQTNYKLAEGMDNRSQGWLRAPLRTANLGLRTVEKMYWKKLSTELAQNRRVRSAFILYMGKSIGI